jgi:hypothetical protein
MLNDESEFVPSMPLDDIFAHSDVFDVQLVDTDNIFPASATLLAAFSKSMAIFRRHCGETISAPLSRIAKSPTYRFPYLEGSGSVRLVSGASALVIATES